MSTHDNRKGTTQTEAAVREPAYLDGIEVPVVVLIAPRRRLPGRSGSLHGPIAPRERAGIPRGLLPLPQLFPPQLPQPLPGHRRRSLPAAAGEPVGSSPDVAGGGPRRRGGLPGRGGVGEQPR